MEMNLPAVRQGYHEPNCLFWLQILAYDGFDICK